MVPHAGEHIEQRSIGRCGAPYVVGGDNRHTKPAGELGQRRVFTFLVAQEMALQLDAHVAAPEEADQSIEQATHTVVACVEHGPARQCHQPGRETVELLESKRSFALRCAQLHAGYEATEIFVTVG